MLSVHGAQQAPAFSGSFWVDGDIATYQGTQRFKTIADAFERRNADIEALPDSVQLNYGSLTGRAAGYVEIAMKPRHGSELYVIVRPGYQKREKWWHWPKAETWDQYTDRVIRIAASEAKRVNAR